MHALIRFTLRITCATPLISIPSRNSAAAIAAQPSRGRPLQRAGRRELSLAWKAGISPMSGYSFPSKLRPRFAAQHRRRDLGLAARRAARSPSGAAPAGGHPGGGAGAQLQGRGPRNRAADRQGRDRDRAAPPDGARGACREARHEEGARALQAGAAAGVGCARRSSAGAARSPPRPPPEGRDLALQEVAPPAALPRPAYAEAEAGPRDSTAKAQPRSSCAAELRR